MLQDSSTRGGRPHPRAGRKQQEKPANYCLPGALAASDPAEPEKAGGAWHTLEARGLLYRLSIRDLWGSIVMRDARLVTTVAEFQAYPTTEALQKQLTGFFATALARLLHPSTAW